MRPEHWLYTIPLRLRSLFRWAQADQELDDELRDHLERKTEEYVAQGMTQKEARRRARLDLEGIEQTKEKCRDARRVKWIQDFVQDSHFGLRMLRKSPGFTAVAVLTLALGIGANTAIFSVVNTVLLKPLPYPESDRLVMIWEENLHRGWFENIVSAANFLDWQKQNDVFSGMAAFESNYFTLTGENKPQEVAGESVTTNLFSVLGVQPLRGRLFLPEEEKQGNAASILSYGLWQERYGGDPGLIGNSITVNGQRLTVVGVLPPSFVDDYSASFDPRSRLWVSGLDLRPVGREDHNYHVLARLKPGVNFAQAQAEMKAIASRLEQEYPESKGWGVALVQLHEQTVRETRPALLVLLCAVGLVLFLGCANVANLLLVRAMKREREIAIRTALGASRGRIVRQLLIESILVSLLGALLGLFLATRGSQILARLSPPETPGFQGSGINGIVLLFSIVVALSTGVLFGLAPALQASKTRLAVAIKESGQSAGHGLKHSRQRDALVVCEFGLALTLLFGAGLMIQTLVHLNRVHLGFDPENVVAMKVPLQGSQYAEPQKQAQFFQQLLARIEALPGVQAASVTRGVPMLGWAGWGFVTADNPYPPAGEVPDANYIVVGPDYFKTMGVPIRAGRSFSETDNPSGEPAVIVSESLAQKYWPGQNPIEKRLKVSSDANDKNLPWRTVVGVAGNVRSQGQFAPFVPEIYVPYTQFPWILYPQQIVVRTGSNPTAIVEAIRQEVLGLDKDVPVSEVSSMQDIVAGTIRQGRTVTWLLGAFAALGLFLAGIGIYSVISYAVSQRTREIGIRMALGASRQTVTRMVIRQSSFLATIGVAVGLLGALGISGALSSLPGDIRTPLLFDVAPFDPLTLASVLAILVLVALAACYLPARRAARVDPMVALRYE